MTTKAARAVRCDVRGAIATVTMDRPERRNAMSSEMVTEMYETLLAISLRRDVRIVVLSGSGDRFFCPGADLAGRPADAGPSEPPNRAAFHIPTLLHGMPQVTIAAINGAVAGAGMGWACACDLRVAVDHARFNVAFLAVGVAGDMALPWTLPRIVGPSVARELFFLREKFDAPEAKRLGLVSEVYAAATFRADVDALVDRLAASAPNALTTMKANFLTAERTTLADFVELETERHLRLVTGAEFREGSAAFAEGRPPRFEQPA